jgi:1-acyl-sn-glycerol-3-phosphate acyltransferase
MPAFARLIKPVADRLVTLMLWAYFLFGYLVFFAPLFAGAYLLAPDHERAYQRLLNRFCRSFFWLMQRLMPRLVIEVTPELRRLRSAVVVSNHQSYLDPLLMISVFERQKTIVKSDFFRVPIFGWILQASGYIPAVAGGMQTGLMADRIDRLGDFFSAGGVLFIFPEGTRSRDGRIGKLKWGAFKIADRFKVPVDTFFIDGSRHIFTPGKFLFNTCVANTIRIERLGRLDPVDESTAADLSAQVETVRSLMEKRQALAVDPHNV